MKIVMIYYSHATKPSGIIENFSNSKNAESIAYEKAKNGSLKDKEDFLSKYPGSVHANEIRGSKDANVVKAHESLLLKLEQENIQLNADFKKTKNRGNLYSYLMFPVGLLAGAVGYVDLKDDGDRFDPREYNMIKNKSTAINAVRVGTVLFVWGLVGGISKEVKKQRLEKKLKKMKNL